MVDELAHKEIGALQARCMVLESRVAALTAFACAILEKNQMRDQIQTRWSNHMGPALKECGPGIRDETIKFSGLLPGWISHRLEDENP